MPTRDASARWTGALRDGTGSMRSESGEIDGPFSFDSRFDDGSGTNPEELIAAAHAGCFSMALANELSSAGHPPTSVDTTAKVHLERVEDGFTIPRIDLVTSVEIEGFDDDEFQRIAAETSRTCPVSDLLDAEITLDATLVRA